jgi:hypothetical protein
MPQTSAMMLDQLVANVDAYTAPASSEQVQRISVNAVVAVLQQGSTSVLQLVRDRGPLLITPAAACKC